MRYFLLRLAFDTSVHFGGSDSAVGRGTSGMKLCADTIFSALCHTALEMSGQGGVERLCAAAKEGEFLLSDAMPWHGEDFYLPKPLAASCSAAEVPTVQRKAVKKLAWIPVVKFSAYTDSLKRGFYCIDEKDVSFGESYELTKAHVAEGEDAQPYSVGLYRFFEGCGLYIICGCREEGQIQQLAQLFELLGMSGIGGKTSAGYGRFHLEGKTIDLDKAADAQQRWLRNALETASAPYLLLTSSLPQDEEMNDALEGAAFQLVRRGGFAATEQADVPYKKKTQYFLAAGSVLQHTYEGALYDAGLGLPHPAYRYAKPLFMGVRL